MGIGMTYSQIHHSVIKSRRQSNPRKLNVLCLHLFTNQQKYVYRFWQSQVLEKEYGTYSLEVGFGTSSIIDREWKLINLDGGEDLIVDIKKKEKKEKGVSIKREHMERTDTPFGFQLHSFG